MRLPHLYTDAYILESASKLVATAARPPICQLMQKFTEDAASFDSDHDQNPTRPRAIARLNTCIFIFCDLASPIIRPNGSISQRNRLPTHHWGEAK
jgi:hypothetical protein